MDALNRFARSTRFSPLLAAVVMWSTAGISLADELQVDSSIEHVSVFLSGAEVTRRGSVTIPAGEHRLIIQGLLRHDLLQAAILRFQGLETPQVADGHAGVLGLPVIVGSVAHPVFTAEIGDFGAGFPFLEHGDDLFFGVLLCFH